MPKYKFYYGGKKTKTGLYLLLGEVDYPYELRKGDIVIIGENFINKLREENVIDSNRQQYYVGAVHHWIDPVKIADVYLVEELD